MTTKNRNGYLMVTVGLLGTGVVSAFSFLALPLSQHSRCAFVPPMGFQQECRIRSNVPRSLLLFSESKSASSSVAADDIDSLQALFNKYCDKDGLMTKAALAAMPPFCNMLKDEDLLMEELDDAWRVAPKFPEVSGQESRIDVDSFVQIYRDIDNLFEEEIVVVDEGAKSATKELQLQDTKDDDSSALEDEDETVEAELERVYEGLCDKAGLISKDALKKWDEVQKLLAEGLLGDDEFEDLWMKTTKSPGSSDLLLDVDGFLSFNVALDSLFEFDDEEDQSFQQSSGEAPVRKMVEGDELPPGVLFAALADEDYLVGMNELKYWAELQDMLAQGDLLQSELQEAYDKVKKNESGKLDEDGFIKLYEEIDSLFDEDEELESTSSSMASKRVKDDLIAFLDVIVEDDQLPCGLECSEKDQKQVLNIVSALEEQPTNFVTSKKGNVQLKDLAGTWELLYTSSAAMKFNKGLSGLGGSFPNGKFGGLLQTFKADKYLTDVEYKERIEVTPSTASFDVTVTGNWDIRSSVSLFTGKPSIVIEIEPDRVNYGPTSTRADHWKSLGPMNMLDLAYLDEDFRVMRGCTSTDTVFVFKRVE